jgi:hypothetical protein
LGKTKTLEVVIRGDLIERNVLLKLGRALADSKLRADFSASIIVPPFQKAMIKRYPSLGVLHVVVEIEDLFRFEALLKELLSEEKCEITSIRELCE